MGQKLSQTQAGYNSVGMTDGRACANCNWFEGDWTGCRVVNGTIQPTGLSNMYMPMQEYQQEPIPVTIVAGGTPVSMKSTLQSVPVLGKLFGEGEVAEPPITLFRTKEGALRFFCHPSNCFRDREHEILTSSAHKEYAEWVTNNPQYYPELQIWHTKGCKVGQVEWVDFADDFLCAAGVVYKEYEEHVIKAVQLGAGMSHGFFPVQHNDEVVAYRSFEFTILPVDYACNTFTDFNVLDWSEKDMGFTAAKRKYFETLGFTAEQIAQFETTTKGMSDSVRALGIEYKDTSETDEALTLVPQIVALTEAVTAMGTAMGTLVAAQQAQATEIAAVKEIATKSNEQLVEEQFKARVDSQPQGFIASQASSNVDDNASAKLKENPAADFFNLIGQQALQGYGVPNLNQPFPQAVQGFPGVPVAPAIPANGVNN